MLIKTNLTEKEFCKNNKITYNKNIKSIYLNDSIEYILLKGQSFSLIDGVFKVFSVYTIQYEFKNNKDFYFLNLFLFVKNIENNDFYFYEHEMTLNNKFYLNDDDFLFIYKKIKNNIMNTSLYKSIYILSGYSFKQIFDDKNPLIKDYESNLFELYPFIRKKDYKLADKNIFYKIKDIATTYTSLSIDNDNLLLDLLDYQYDDLKDILTATSEYKSLKKIIPNLTKKSFHLIKNIINGKNDVLQIDKKLYHYVPCFYLNIFVIFKNQKNLESFLENIHSASSSDNFDLIINYFKKDELFFLENILPTFFKNQNKFEKECISYLLRNNDLLKNNTLKEYEIFLDDYNKFEKSLYINSEKDEDFKEHNDELEKEMYIYDNLPGIAGSYELFANIIEDIVLNYNKLEKIKKEIDNENDKEYIQFILNQKYNTLDELHDELGYTVNSIGEKRINFSTNSLKIKSLETNDLIIKEVLSNHKLKELGLKLFNCVGGYESKILNKKSSIYYILNKNTEKFIACIEYSLDTNSIIQAKAKYNKKIKCLDTLSLIQDFCIKNNIEIKTNDLI